MRRRELLSSEKIKPGLPEAPGCYIAFHRKSDGANCAVTAEEWPELEVNGEEADGVLLAINGRDPIVIAPTQVSSNGVYWAGSAVACNTFIQSNNQIKIDFNGRNYIANIVAKVSGNYAGPLCYQYSRPGIPTTKWWLPSGGELYAIYENNIAINLCLGVISGSSQIKDAVHWSSTEGAVAIAWLINPIRGNLTGVNKDSLPYPVRAVAAFE